MMQKKGFTVIELLAVVAIIAALTSVVLAATTNYIKRSKNARASADISQFIKMAYFAEGQSGSRLEDITHSGCSDCICRDRDIKNISEDDPCYIQWINALQALQNAAGSDFSGIKSMDRDAWGSPYMLDENEREAGDTDCRPDTIRSAGADGFGFNADDIVYDMDPHIPCP